jgi:hypothetical protein
MSPATRSLEPQEHPQFRMWQDRLDAEIAQEAARAARRVLREVERQEWYAAWHDYKENRTVVLRAVRPRWWNAPGWLLYRLRLHAPGRPN